MNKFAMNIQYWKKLLESDPKLFDKNLTMIVYFTKEVIIVAIWWKSVASIEYFTCQNVSK